MCLQDTVVLGNVLRGGDSKHVIHLVYTPTAERVKLERRTSNQQNSASPELRHRNNVAPTTAGIASPNAITTPPAPGTQTNQQQQMFQAYMHNYAN